MRPIKFRAWDKDLKKMYYFDLIQLKHFKDNKHLWGLELTMPLMEFTGLLDKNGKEIYEDDILLAPSGKKFIVKNGIEKIQDNEGYGWNTVCGFYLEDTITACGFYLEDTITADKYLAKEHMDDIDILEVIGNIYEHPSLL